jgi:hypothetical protein
MRRPYADLIGIRGEMKRRESELPASQSQTRYLYRAAGRYRSSIGSFLQHQTFIKLKTKDQLWSAVAPGHRRIRMAAILFSRLLSCRSGSSNFSAFVRAAITGHEGSRSALIPIDRMSQVMQIASTKPRLSSGHVC